MSTHAFEVGKPASAKWADSLGYTGIRMKVKPSRSLGLLCGPPGCGKTSFLLSNPDCYHINLDRSSTPTDDCKAVTWPGINEDGILLDTANAPMSLTWGKVEEKLNLLYELADKDQPRPAMIAFDSLSSVIPILQSHLIHGRFSKGGLRQIWADLDGQLGWGTLYDIITTKMVEGLRSRGYGVWFTAHVTNTVIAMGENANKMVPNLVMTNGLWSRLFPQFEIVVAMVKEPIEETVTFKKDLGNGKSKTIEKVNKLTVPHLTARQASYEGITKVRQGFLMEDWRVPLTNAWPEFESLYMAQDSSTSE